MHKNKVNAHPLKKEYVWIRGGNVTNVYNYSGDFNNSVLLK